jgi:hypothetical protein
MLWIRDHLFALLGLARDSDNAAFGLNYDESFDLIVKRYAAEFVSRGQGVLVIALAGLNVKSDRFPSWIPDWTRETTTQHNRLNSLTMESEEKILRLYRASGASRPQMPVDIDPNILIVRGGLVDVVLKVGQSHPELPIDHFFDRLQESQGMAASPETYPNGVGIGEARLRALTRNRI